MGRGGGLSNVVSSNNNTPSVNNTPGVAKQSVNNTKPSSWNTAKPVDTAINTPSPIATATVNNTAGSNAQNTKSELKKAGIETPYGLNIDAFKYAKDKAELKGITLHQEIKDMGSKE